VSTGSIESRRAGRLPSIILLLRAPDRLTAEDLAADLDVADFVRENGVRRNTAVRRWSAAAGSMP